jgi:hypothetical protein
LPAATLLLILGSFEGIIIAYRVNKITQDKVMVSVSVLYVNNDQTSSLGKIFLNCRNIKMSRVSASGLKKFWCKKIFMLHAGAQMLIALLTDKKFSHYKHLFGTNHLSEICGLLGNYTASCGK